MKKLLILVLLIPIEVFGQFQQEPKSNPMAIGLVPQYAFTNGIRIDFDIPLDNSSSLVIAPQFYAHSGGGWIWNYEELAGFGVNIKHRRYLMQTENMSGFYLSYGPTFQTFSISEQALMAEEFIENGASYIELVNGKITSQVYKFGLDFAFGARLVAGKLLYVDPFIGMGVRASFDNKTTGLHKNYNDFWYDLGYTGVIIITGLRFGVLL